MVGSHGHGLVRDLLLGQTVDKVRHGLDVPMLIARPDRAGAAAEFAQGVVLAPNPGASPPKVRTDPCDFLNATGFPSWPHGCIVVAGPLSSDSRGISPAPAPISRLARDFEPEAGMTRREPPLSMSEPKLCQRCQKPTIGVLTALVIEAEGSEAESPRLTVCGSCLSSYRRWTTRPKRQSVTRPEPTKSRSAEEKRSNRVRGRGGSATPTGRWERLAPGTRLRRLGVTVSFILAVYVTIAMIAYWLIQSLPPSEPPLPIE